MTNSREFFYLKQSIVQMFLATDNYLFVHHNRNLPFMGALITSAQQKLNEAKKNFVTDKEVFFAYVANLKVALQDYKQSWPSADMCAATATALYHINKLEQAA